MYNYENYIFMFETISEDYCDVSDDISNAKLNYCIMSIGLYVFFGLGSWALINNEIKIDMVNKLFLIYSIIYIFIGVFGSIFFVKTDNDPYLFKVPGQIQMFLSSIYLLFCMIIVQKESGNDLGGKLLFLVMFLIVFVTIFIFRMAKKHKYSLNSGVMKKRPSIDLIILIIPITNFLLLILQNSIIPLNKLFFALTCFLTVALMAVPGTIISWIIFSRIDKKTILPARYKKKKMIEEWN